MAAGRGAALAPFADSDAADRADEGLGEAADFGMARRHGGERAALPLNGPARRALHHLRDTAQRVQGVRRHRQAGMCVAGGRGDGHFFGDAPTGLSRGGFDLAAAETLAQHGEHLTQDMVVRLGEEAIRAGGEAVFLRGFAAAAGAALARLIDQSVTFQQRELGANGVVGEVERLGQFVHRGGAAAEVLQQAATRGGEEALIPSSSRHGVFPSSGRLRLPCSMHQSHSEA